MPSYTQSMRQIAAMDANDDDIESWITVKGNHIPIKKGQSKEDAVKSFIAGKKKNLVENHNSLVEAMNLEEKGYFKKDPRKRDSITQSAIEMGKEEKNLEELMEFGVKEANSAKSEKKENGRYERPVHISEPLKDVVAATKAKMEKKEPTAVEKPKKELSSQAQVAKTIKNELKSMGFNATAKSDSYSGGDSVIVKVDGWYSDDIKAEIKKKFGKYQKGDVNPYEDIYEYNNVDHSIPQTKYLFIEYGHPTDADMETIKEYYRSHWDKRDVEEFNNMSKWEQENFINRRFVVGYNTTEKLKEVKAWADKNNKEFSYKTEMPNAEIE